MLKLYINNFSQAFGVQSLQTDSLAKCSNSWMLLESLSRCGPNLLQNWESTDLIPLKRHRMNKVKENQEDTSATMQSKNYFLRNPERHKNGISCFWIKDCDACSFLFSTWYVTGCEEKQSLYFNNFLARKKGWILVSYVQADRPWSYLALYIFVFRFESPLVTNIFPVTRCSFQIQRVKENIPSLD